MSIAMLHHVSARPRRPAAPAGRTPRQQTATRRSGVPEHKRGDREELHGLRLVHEVCNARARKV
eukprot:3935395-Rhodomonas_salina.2